MKKKVSTLIVICMLASLILSACGGGESQNANQQSGATLNVSESLSETPQANKGVTIEYVSMWNETERQAEVIKKAAEEYEKDTGNKVNITWVGRETDKTIRVLLEAGENANVDVCGGESIFTRTHKEYYIDLTEYTKKPYASLGGKTLDECMNPALVGVMKEIVGGDGLYGIPYQPYVICFHYNKDHFDDIGVTDPPKTWAEFMDVCQKLKDAGHIPTTIDDAYRDLMLGYPLARMKGVEYVSEMMNDKSLWQDDGVRAALKIYEDMAAKGYWDEAIASTIWPAGQNEVAQGNISMYLTGTWLPNELLTLTGPDMRWGGFLFPVMEGQTMSDYSSMFGAFTFNIPKSSKVKDEAFEFITYMVNSKYDQMMCQETVGIPLAQDGAWPDILKDIKPAFDKIDGFIEWGGGISANNDTKTLALTEFARLLGGEITADQFIESMSK